MGAPSSSVAAAVGGARTSFAPRRTRFHGRRRVKHVDLFDIKCNNTRWGAKRAGKQQLSEGEREPFRLCAGEGRLSPLNTPLIGILARW